MNVSVELISRPRFLDSVFARFLASDQLEWIRSQGATEAEEIVEVAGRMCYLSFGPRQSPRTNSEYIANLIAMGHESVLEHVAWTFLLTGVSRAFSHQLVRHRVGFAFSQLSQQYHDEGDATFIEPPGLRDNPDAHAIWSEMVSDARDGYRKLRDLLTDGGPAGQDWPPKERQRAIRSAARSVLPNATATKIVVTANARALRYFLSVRGATLGDLEMRLACARILECLRPEAPSIFADFQVHDAEDGYPIVRKIARRA